MRIYLDCCCYNRPFDDQSQDRIHDEGEAVLSIIKRSRKDGNILVGSTVLRLEISRIADPDKRLNVEMLYSSVAEEIPYSEQIRARAEAIRSQVNIKNMDSLHLASAEAGHVEIFLTTDDHLLKKCREIKPQLRVMNPVSLLAENIEHGE